MSHVAYLEAKRALDDRSLNRDVLARFAERLPSDPSGPSGPSDLSNRSSPSVLEVGAGTATMVERLHDWGVIEHGTWVAVDSHEPALQAGAKRLADREDATRIDDDFESEDTVAVIRLGDCRVELFAADAFAFVDETDRRFDAVVGCAFLDIVDPEPAVEAFGAVAPLLYAPITYDGETTFRPSDADDPAVLDRYHRHMREFRSGGPEGATDLARRLDVLAAGPSAWRIEPPYADGERVVLSHLLDTMETAVGETGYDAEAWADRRRAALDDDVLRYEACNRDVLGRI